ncbi:zinc dependent phospholipase C family protein [Paenibacillus marchantiae]|uniref:zinc dependent phospholipase C family protein n=1 Tax=Paenibacillus marchantiae TaxID=3026433 RepID=UPI00237A6F4E|nr:zinc dependent phospholipase C family protein [Paenibacillus marchantiae]WDQ35164.1 zinc dependent phospholipase C family protein [Paenibacillus marchantiae]
MVHFAIASELLSDPTPEFIVGSLAPDSIHVRTNERAEKAKTHLMPEAGRFATDEELRAFFNSNKKRAQSEPKFMQYLCGYISHVYTDRVWTFEIYPAFEEHANGRSIYTQDVTKLEFMILRRGSDGQDLLNKLEAGQAFDLGGLLEQEVYQYRKEKVDFLNNFENEPLDDLNILSMEAIEEFIQTTAQRLRQLFTKWEVF